MFSDSFTPECSESQSGAVLCVCVFKPSLERSSSVCVDMVSHPSACVFAHGRRARLRPQAADAGATGTGACGPRLVLWEARSLDQKESRWSSPALGSSRPRPPRLSVAGVKGRARKRLLAQSLKHSGIPPQSKSEPTRPLPGDQWAAMLFKYKVTTATGGGGGETGTRQPPC